MKKKILGALGIIALGFLVYLLAFSNSKINKPESQTKETATTPTPETEQKKETKGPFKLLYRQNFTSFKSPHPGNQVVEIRTIDFKTNEKKLIFTDLDEDLQIRLVDGIADDSLLIYATAIAENAGSIWEIKMDGSGSKKKIISDFNASFFRANLDKIAFISYDNIKGVYGLWIMNKDGRFKTKILESETVLSDPVFISDNKLAFIKITQEGGGVIVTTNLDGSDQKEILKAKGQLFGLNFAASKFTYIKANDVYICDVNGQNEKRITNDNKPENYPILSSDGSLIAFYKEGKIWISNSDGNEQKALVEGAQPIGFLP
jgi:Tol biopolymer transport system component